MTLTTSWSAPVWNCYGTPCRLGYKIWQLASTDPSTGLAVPGLNDTSSVASTTNTFTDLWPGNDYQFRVSATNTEGDSPYSTALVYTTPTAVPDRMLPATPSYDGTSSSILGSWQALPYNNGRVIERCVPSAGLWLATL